MGAESFPVNIRELARLVGVSKSTVSLALRDDPSIPQATQDKVKEAAKKHGYRRNPKLSEVMGGIAKRSTVPISAPIALLSLWPVKKAWEKVDSGFLIRSYQGLMARGGARIFGGRILGEGARDDA